MSHFQLLMEKFGVGFVAIGLFFAFFNWIFLLMNLKLRREKANRHVSMIYVFGVLMPIGCLIVEPLRPHALWIWLIDPASTFLVCSPLYALIRKFQSRQK